MKLISTLSAAATILAATSIVPAGAMTPARIDTAQLSPLENAARVCREVCRRGVCRETCRWRPDRPRVESYSYGAYGRPRGVRPDAVYNMDRRRWEWPGNPEFGR
jgi:hypothetical protein